MAIAPFILLHSPPRAGHSYLSNPSYQSCLKLSFFLPSSLARLSVAAVRSAGFCRPHVSDDNPFSESQFKTPKYRPEFRERFGSIQDARGFCQRFSPWYNAEHYHSGIGLLAPELLHYGRPMESSANAKLSSARLSNGIPNASSERISDHRHGLPPCGSIRRPRRQQLKTT